MKWVLKIATLVGSSTSTEKYIFVGWVERSETQQGLLALGFVPQPNLQVMQFLLWAFDRT